MVANRQERGCGRQHRARSRVDRISGRTNGRGKRTKSGSNTSVVPVSYSCRTNIVLAVLDRQRSGAKATIWWFCHDHDRSGRSAMIGNIGKEWSAQCDLGLTYVTLHTTWRTPKEPKIDMSISQLKRLPTRWFQYTLFNVAILIAMRRPNKSHLVEMRCYWWLKNRRVDRNVRSVHAAVNRNVKYREP